MHSELMTHSMMANDNPKNWRDELSQFIVPSLEDTGNPLGTGAYGEVVEMKMKGERVAVKKIHPVFKATKGWETALANFGEECVRLSFIHHLNIVSFLGVHFEDDSDIPMLVMEYVPMCLRQYVEGKIPPDGIKTSILLGIAQGLQYLHGLDPPMIHRDLTANNVLLTENLCAKIADLGVSKLLNRKALEALTNIPGNESHMPPEARVGDRQHYSILSTDEAKKLDIFSFGNVLINMLTGEFPVAKADRDERGIRRTEVQRRNHLLIKIPESKEKDLVIRCLNFNPNHRPTIDQVVDFFKGLPAEEGDSSEMEISFVERPPYDVKCPHCSEIFEDVHLTTCCSQHVCGQCCNKLRKGSCPLCGVFGSISTADKPFTSLVLSLQVKCCYSKRGCPWSGDLGVLKQHLEETCRKASICQHCSFECTRQAFPEHVSMCAEAPQPCPNCCSATGVKRKHLKHHLERECVLRMMDSDTVPHAANQCIHVAPLAVTMTSYSQYVSTGNTWYSPPFYTHKNGYKVHLRVDANLYKSGYLSVLVCVLKGEYDSTLTWPLYAEVKVALYNWRTNKPLFSKVLHLPGDVFCSMNTTNLPASWGNGDVEFISHASLASDLANNVEYIQHDCLNFQIEEVTIVKAPAIPKLPLWVGDGCFAVPSFHSVKVPFYGSPIYTHMGGYKLCPFIYPNGYGKGKGTHVSVCCTLMCGEHDDALPWPVEADVVLEMFNWRENKNHRRYTVSLSHGADAKSSSRVTIDGIAELGRGNDTFAAHSSLSYNATSHTQYLNEDCLLFKVVSCTAYLNKASASKLPAWMDPVVMGPPYLCFTVSELAKRKEFNNKYYSPPFYSQSEHGGYKMHLKITPYTNEQSQHISLYARLLKGENDETLDWPFCGDVVVELLNWRQDANHHSYTISFHERVPSKASGRVLVGDSASSNWGTDSFISHDSLTHNHSTNTEYLQDDYLCFRVKVVVYSKALTNKVPRWQAPNTPACFTIADVAKRMESGNGYYSPPFVAAKYKMCLKMYCGGDGAGKGTHVSMYACLLKGEDDDSLEWPFCGDIIVEVLNWRGDHDHYKNVLSLDSPDDPFHARVMTEVTSPAGRGKQKFMPLPTLSSKYLEDECMRICVSSVVCYNTPALMSKTPRWQKWWNTPRWPLAFTVTGFLSRLENGSTCYSPPFYTHRRGYKMRLKVTPGGVSWECKGNMSVHAQLMAGEYDSSLQWPMNVELTVETVNWARNSSHVTKTIDFGNAPIDCRTRVPKESKVTVGGRGFGKFCSHAILFGGTHDIVYVEDDCVHIRVTETVVHSR